MYISVTRLRIPESMETLPLRRRFWTASDHLQIKLNSEIIRNCLNILTHGSKFRSSFRLHPNRLIQKAGFHLKRLPTDVHICRSRKLHFWQPKKNSWNSHVLLNYSIPDRDVGRWSRTFCTDGFMDLYNTMNPSIGVVENLLKL